MDIKSFTSALIQIAEEKGISQEKVQEIIEQAIAAAYKKDYGKKGQIIKAELDPKSGQVKFWQQRLVVEPSMILTEEEMEKLKKEKTKEEPPSVKATEGKVRFNPEKHILLEEVKKTDPQIQAGQEFSILLKTEEAFGRIAAQTAKQVILQRIREAEREAVFGEYKSKEGEIISGIVQRIEGKNIFLDIGKTLGILAKEEQIPGEFYRLGQRLKVYILRVEETPKGPVVFLSRSYPKIISKLFELEVPEISAGQVQIKSIAREPGSRSKIAALATQEGIDPIGSMVGQRGTRVTTVISELGGEKIDIIEYSEDPEKYIKNALSPAKIEEVKILPQNKALAICSEDQLSLAIGKNGQNVRLAAKLTGWKIDVRSPAKEGEEKIEKKELHKVKRKTHGENEKLKNKNEKPQRKIKKD